MPAALTFRLRVIKSVAFLVASLRGTWNPATSVRTSQGLFPSCSSEPAMAEISMRAASMRLLRKPSTKGPDNNDMILTPRGGRCLSPIRSVDGHGQAPPPGAGHGFSSVATGPTLVSPVERNVQQFGDPTLGVFVATIVTGRRVDACVAR